MKQAAVADRLILTKPDLADADKVSALETRLAALNPAAPRLRAVRGDIDPAALFGLGVFDPETKSVEVRRWLNDEALADAHDDHGHAHHDVNRHDDKIRAFCVTRERPIPWDALSGWLDALASMRGDDLLRMKAIVAIAERPEQPVVLHGVQHIFHPPVLLPQWPSDDRRSRIVFITRGLPRETIEETLAAFMDADPPAAVSTHGVPHGAPL